MEKDYKTRTMGGVTPFLLRDYKKSGNRAAHLY